MNYELLFLDTETTSVEDGRLIQLATLEERSKGCLTFKPPVPVTIEAMAVHHITNEMLENRWPFDPESFQEAELKNPITKNEKIIVAHNAKFDVEVLRREGVVIDDKKVIDTMRVAQHLVDSPSYSLQYLRYFLKLEFAEDAENIKPHDAWGDVVVLKGLFDCLANKIIDKNVFEVENYNFDNTIIEKMLELSQTPVLIKKIRFGKYKDKTFEEIKTIDIGYLNWLFNQPDLDEDLKFTINYHLTN